MKHFYNIINKYIDNTDLESDIFTLERKRFFESNGQPLKEKLTFNNDDHVTTYDISMALGSVAVWVQKQDSKVVTQVTKLDDDKYTVSFFNDDVLFKKYTFSVNHVFKFLEYYDKEDSSKPICTFEPRRSRYGLVILYNRQGTRERTILYPVQKPDDSYISEKIKEQFNDYIVRGSTDEGVVLFLSDEQKMKYLECLRDIKAEMMLEQEPESYIDEDSISLGKIIDPHSFNVKRNLASNIDINKANEFSDETESEEEIIERINMMPDKIISRDMEYMYFGEVDENNCRSGYGRTALSNGRTAYEGEYENDMRAGKGSYYYKNGTLCYTGDWSDNKRNGVGVGISSRDGSLHAGTWKDNLPVGSGVRLNSDGSIKFIRRELSGGGYIKITFGHNDSIIMAQYDENDKLLATKGFSKLN